MFLAGVIVSEERDLLGVIMLDRFRADCRRVASRALFVRFGFASLRVLWKVRARVRGRTPTRVRGDIRMMRLFFFLSRKVFFIPGLEIDTEMFKNHVANCSCPRNTI